MKKIDVIGLVVIVILLTVIGGIGYNHFFMVNQVTTSPALTTQEETVQPSVLQTARIMANGDLLYHDLLYMSALKSDNTYDFKSNYEYVKPWLEQADLAIGDFEGTIRADYPLGGYPLFNAPTAVSDAIKWAGYDVVDLAHNHILDSGLIGLQTTYQTFKKQGITPIGVYVDQTREQSDSVIKEVNGIKIALLAYTYGFNGLDASLSSEAYQAHLSDLNEEKMQKEIERAETLADVTIVFPQMGIEYALEPNEEQKTLYHKMITWGADVIFGGHPHVVQPSEVVVHNDEKKLIIYAMGNFLSNQRLETLNNLWTERGVLMDVTFEKTADKTIIKTAKAHPTWVSRVSKGTYSPEGYALYDYKVFVLEDFIAGGKYRQTLDKATQERIDAAYNEMNAHVQLNWETSR